MSEKSREVGLTFNMQVVYLGSSARHAVSAVHDNMCFVCWKVASCSVAWFGSVDIPLCCGFLL